MNRELGRLIGAAFGDVPPAFGEAPPAFAAARRRRKLWELPPRWHCPLIGSCVPVAELRKLAARAGFDQAALSDYMLHTLVVGSCDARGGIAEALQRLLDQRYAAAVARFSRARGEAAVLDLWAAALAAGKDVAGALWAAWSHADMSEGGGKAIYGDIHMLSHQVGAAARADLRRLDELGRENAVLRAEAQAARCDHEALLRERDEAIDDLRRRLADAERRAALLARREAELAEARQAARDHPALAARAAALAARVETVESRHAEQCRRAELLATELAEARAGLAVTEAALDQAFGTGAADGDETVSSCAGVSGTSACGRGCPAEAALAGRCVLCIGGRTGLVDGYRRLVEAGGGRFRHHDGGQQESLHRLDAAVAGADAVVCQAGCVSHAAYYRLKDACRKLGKPCVFLKSPGIGSFARGLAALAGDAVPDAVPVHLAGRGDAS